MIVRPSIDKILRAISRDLEGEVLDAIDDQTVRVTVQMMAQLLDAMARRYANESEFIRDESSTVMSLATQIADKNPSASSLQDAIELARKAIDQNSIDHYEAVSEVLSCLAEVILASHSPADAQALQLLFKQRTENEIEIITDEFQPIGRA